MLQKGKLGLVYAIGKSAIIGKRGKGGKNDYLLDSYASLVDSTYGQYIPFFLKFPYAVHTKV